MLCLGFILVADMVFVQQSARQYVLLAMQSGFRFLTSLQQMSVILSLIRIFDY